MPKLHMRFAAVGAALASCLAVTPVFADTVLRVREGDMSCDRACLNGFVDRYLDAMAAHDPSTLSLARDVRMTENTVQMNMRNGLWHTATAIGQDNKQYIPDVFAQQAGYIGVIYEADGPKMLSLRLRIKNMEIREVEMVTARPGSSDPMGNNLPNWKPKPIWDYTLKPSERRERHELVQIANQYFEAIEQDKNGMISYSDDCTWANSRAQNGTDSNIPDPDAPPPPPEFAAMMNAPCDAMFGQGMMTGLEIPERSYWSVDEDKGVVLGAFIFQSPNPVVLEEGQASATSGGGLIGTQPNSGIIVEVFKIIDGKIHRQDGVTGMIYAYGTRTGW